MAQSISKEVYGIGLDDESWRALSCVEASSLLRVLSLADIDDRIYSNAQIFPLADGKDLYVRPQ